MSIRYRSILACSAVCAVISSGAANAQSQPATGTDATPAASSEIETIVVTAQRRAERDVDTPVSIFAATGEQLQERGFNDLQDLQTAVPGVHMDANGLAFQPTIRGVGSAISGPGDSANVATYIDGFYRPSMNSNDMKFDDVESLQVLEGPQGTLFGRNATGGAILVSTNAPSFDFAADGRLSYGTYNTLDGSGFITGGLSDDVAGSLSAFVSRSDGAVKNVLTNDDQANYTDWGLRSKLLYNPTEQLSFTLTYEHNQINDPTFIAYNAYHGWSDGALMPGTVVATKPDETSISGNPINKVQNDGLYLKGTDDLGWATLTSYTGGSHETVFNQLDLSASSAPLELVNWDIYEDTITQELDLTSEGAGPFQWVTGLYYYGDNQVYTNYNVSVLGSPYFVAFGEAGQRTNSFAAFADGTYNFWKDFYLTLGGRFSNDHIAESFILGATGPSQNYSHGFDSVKPRAVLRYQPTPDSSVYFSYSQGYKAGVYNVFGEATTPVKPENITAYELGYKFASTDWTFDSALFYYDYKDLQVNTYVQFTSELVNAASSGIYGLDANLTGKITDNLTLNAGAAYTHARYLSFPDDPAYTWNPALGVQIGTVNGKNFTMQRVPEFQSNIGLDYSHALAGGKLDLLADYSFQTKTYLDPADVTDQPAYSVLNLRASWTNSDGRWIYSIFGNNVTDTHYITQVLPVGFAFNQAWAAPAIVGAEVRLRY